MAIEALEEQLPGPCCGGPAIHDRGAEVIRALVARVEELEANGPAVEAAIRQRKEIADLQQRLTEAEYRYEQIENLNILNRKRAEAAEQQLAALKDGLFPLLRIFEPGISGRIPSPQDVIDKLTAQRTTLRTLEQEIRRNAIDWRSSLLSPIRELCLSWADCLASLHRDKGTQ